MSENMDALRPYTMKICKSNSDTVIEETSEEKDWEEDLTISTRVKVTKLLRSIPEANPNSNRSL